MKTVLVYIAMSAIPYVAYADTVAQPQLAEIYASAASLLKSESLIQRNDLSDEAHVDVMLNNSGFAWRKEQGVFQQQLYIMLDRYRELSSDERDGVNLLVKFNNMAVNAMTAMTLCNKIEADWELSMGAAVLDHVKADVESRTVSNWNLDLRTDPKLAGGCK